jgi:Protein of unknown function (DUF1638)
MIPDDAQLTRDGIAAPGTGRVLVIGCGALAREILVLIETNGLDHVDLTCLPAIFHNRPDKIAPALEESIARHKDRYENIFIAYADCGTGGAIAALCARHGLEMIAGPHCYSFFDGNALFASRDEVTAFYLTDFLTRQFEAFVVKPLGLDRHPDLIETYFGNYERVIYLAQTDDPILDKKARAAADMLGLAYERRFTGFGDLAPALAGL